MGQTESGQTVLSVDSGTPFLSLGLMVGNQTFSRVLDVGRTHAERLPAELAALYAEAGYAEAGRPLHTDLIVVGTGPGSYTGLRVGASYALGLGRAWGVPVLGVSTLEGMAGNQDITVAVSMDARKEHLYGAVFRVQGGVVAETLTPAAKYPLADFQALAAGLPWLRDAAPDPLLIARNGLHHGAKDWELSYL